jgi:DNA gyrase/topoisomerase IV subunit A
VQPDNLATKIAELVNSGRLTGIADIRDDTSARTGQRLVIVLKRDAQPRVVMNNLYKHTPLQDTFGCNMLALVDDVPRTLRIDQFLGYWLRTSCRSSSAAPSTGSTTWSRRPTWIAAWSRRSTCWTRSSR